MVTNISNYNLHKWKQWFIFVSSIEQAIPRLKSDNLACFSYIEKHS